MTDRLIVALPDMQVPDQDDKALAAVIRFLRQIQPDEVLIVGDELDSPEPSRWNKGYAGEYAATLQKSVDRVHGILSEIRGAVGDGIPIHLMRSNHGDRIQKYIDRYAPALASLRALDYPTLLGLDELGITFHRKPYEFAPGWVLAHGDEGSLIQTPGATALNLAKRWGKSVVCGHTHKAGMLHHHFYLNGKPNVLLFGMEVGHLMDIKKANYLRAGSANWQQALGVFHVQEKRVHPTLVPLLNRAVVYDGVTY